MKTILLILSTLLSLSMSAQEKVRFTSQNNNNTIQLLAANDFYCPVTVTITFNLVNVQLSNENTVFVIPPRTENFAIVTLSPKEQNKKWSWGYRYDYFLGDGTKKQEANMVFNLPYPTGQSFKVVQGYNGKISHENENAIDFNFPEGTPVCAAKDGIVTEVVDKNNTGCPGKECMQYNNYITLYHEDGSFSSYAHLKQNGAKVKVGQAIKQGDVIGLSGNTGWSSGPHLHFVVFYYKSSQRITPATKFNTENKAVVFLEEGKSYKKDY